jgi:hypothetical protein
MPLNVTEALANWVGNGIELAEADVEPRPVPKIETNDPGLTAWPAAKLAALTMPLEGTTGVVVEDGGWKARLED